MKKVCLLLATIALSGILVSCFQKEATGIEKAKGFDFDAPVNSHLETYSRNDEQFAPFGNAFELDYSVIEPEKEPKVGKISTDFAGSNGRQNIVSRGIRSLSGYITKYNEKRKNYSDFVKAEESSEESGFWENELEETAESSEYKEEKKAEELSPAESNISFSARCDERTGKTVDGKKSPLYIRFSENIDESTLKNQITVGIDFLVPPENMELTGRRLCIFNLPLSKRGLQCSIQLGSGIRSVSGKQLDNASRLFYFEYSRPDSYLKICDAGNRIMEKQFAHKIAFEFQNLKKSNFWTLGKLKNPVKNPWNPQIDSSLEKHFISDELIEKSVDEPYLDGVDLEEFLDDGCGWVSFTANYNVELYHGWKKEYEIENQREQLNVQVTDLGVTARVGINKAVVMVRSLSENTPVPNAEISVLFCGEEAKENSNFDLTLQKPVVKGVTDINGYAVLDISDEKADFFEIDDGSLVLLVNNGTDKIAFKPENHSYASNLKNARKVEPKIFMFCDRGLYKPGETITFRGIDKNQHMGHYSSYEGEYEIALKNSHWGSSVTYATLSGKTSESGGFHGSFVLPEDLEPGNYKLCYNRKNWPAAKWGDHHNLYFQVKYFEGAKIQAQIEIPEKKYFGGDRIPARIKGTYLAGGVLADAACENSWYRNPVRFNPETLDTEGFVFGPSSNRDYFRHLSDEKTTLNGDGIANTSFRTEKIENGATYSYRLEASLTDLSNQRITGNSTVTVHPAKYYVGLAEKPGRGFPEKDRKLEFNYVIVNPDGNKVEPSVVSGNLECILTHITWEISSQNGIGDEIYERYHKVESIEKSENIKPEKQGVISIVPKKSGEYRLTVKGKDKFGNFVCTDYEFYVTGKDSFWFDRNSSEKIEISFDKKMYNPGETAKVLIKSAIPSGDYLITTEREGIFTEELRHFDSPCNVIEIPVAMNYVPAVYVCVASYTPRTGEPKNQFGTKDMEKPKNYYGEACMKVNPYVKAFSVDIQTDKAVYKPGETAKITLKATKNGQPLPKAELTVMGVDRAVLDLLNYHVQNPIEYFYDRYGFEHCVNGGDTRSLIMEPVVYAMKTLNGGDAMELKESSAASEDGSVRTDFKPTAFFEPSVTTDENGTAAFSFVVPSQLTTFRVTAIGVRGELFGYQENEFGVSNPINVQAVQPRRLRVRDTAECGVLLTNLSEKDVEVTAGIELRFVSMNSDVSTESLNSGEDAEESALAIVQGSAFIDGESKKSVVVPAGGSSAIYFDVAAEKAGSVEMVYSIDSEIISEKLVSQIKIEKSYSADTVGISGIIEDESEKDSKSKSKSSSKTETIVLPSWADDGEGSISVTLDTGRLGMLSSAVQYVFDYPFGCFEQRASKLLPLVIFEDYIKTFGLDSKVRNVKSIVKSEFKFMKKYQHSDGGFGYWQDSEKSDLYVSLRIADLYFKAKNRGYSEKTLGIDIKALVEFLQNEVRNEYVSAQTKAYAYSVLAEHTENYFTKDLDALFDSIKKDDIYSYALIGLAYSKGIYKDESKVKKCVEIIRPEIENFHSDEFLANAIKLLVALDPLDSQVDVALKRLFLRMKKGYWKNTRSTASVLDAVYEYIKARELDDVDLAAQANISGIQLVEGEFKGAAAEPVSSIFNFKDDALSALPKDKALELEFNRHGNGRLYYSAIMKYALPDELQNFRDKGIFIDFKIFDADSNKEILPNNDSRVIELENGKNYKLKTVISVSKDRQFLALRVPVPSGASILDANFVTTATKDRLKTENSGSFWSQWRRRMTSQAIYDNEGQFFWDEFEKGNYTVEFQIHAERAGVYPVPPVHAELMYEPEIFGRSNGYLYVIR